MSETYNELKEILETICTTTAVISPNPINLVGRENPSKRARLNKNGMKEKQVNIKEENGMRKIIKTLLEEGIDESMIHRILDLLEDESVGSRFFKASDALLKSDEKLKKGIVEPDRAKLVQDSIETKELMDKARKLNNNLKTQTGTPAKQNPTTPRTNPVKPAPKKDGIDTTFIDLANADAKRQKENEAYRKLWGNKIK